MIGLTLQKVNHPNHRGHTRFSVYIFQGKKEFHNS